jgi:hypothetical protein
MNRHITFSLILLIANIVPSFEAQASDGWLNVKNYGAIGNGSSDDTVAIICERRYCLLSASAISSYGKDKLA